MKPIIPPPVIGVATGFAMWLAAKSTPDLNFIVPAREWIAGAFAIVGLMIEGTAVSAFFREKTTINPLTPNKTQKLVIEGLYKYTRNPMYLGMLLLLTAWAVWLGNPLSLVFLASFVLLINEMQIKPEERALEEKFGEAYIDYKKRVRRWI